MPPESDVGMTNTEAKQAINHAINRADNAKEFGVTAEKHPAQDVDLLRIGDQQEVFSAQDNKALDLGDTQVNMFESDMKEQLRKSSSSNYALDLVIPGCGLQPVLGPNDLGEKNQLESSAFAQNDQQTNLYDELEPKLGPGVQ